MPAPASFLPSDDDYLNPSGTSHVFDEEDQDVLGGLVHSATGSAFLGLYLGFRGSGPYFAANRGMGSGGGNLKGATKEHGGGKVQSTPREPITWADANRALGRDSARLERELTKFDEAPVGGELRSLMAAGLTTRESHDYNLGAWRSRTIAKLEEMKQSRAITQDEQERLEALVIRVDDSASAYWRLYRTIDIAPDDIEDVVMAVERAETDQLASRFRIERARQLENEARRRAQIKNSSGPTTPPTSEPELRIANPISPLIRHLDATQDPGWRERFNSYFRRDRFQQLEETRATKQALDAEKLRLKSAQQRITDRERVLQHKLSQATDDQQKTNLQQQLAQLEERKQALVKRQNAWDAKKREWDAKNAALQSPKPIPDAATERKRQQRRQYKLKRKLDRIEQGLGRARRIEQMYKHKQSVEGNTPLVQETLEEMAQTIRRLEERRAATLRKLEQG